MAKSKLTELKKHLAELDEESPRKELFKLVLKKSPLPVMEFYPFLRLCLLYIP